MTKIAFIPLSVKYGLVFRNSIFSNKTTEIELSMPAMTDDMLRDNQYKVIERKKNKNPTIGFCGYTGVTSYIEMQYKNRKLWEEWLSPEGFI